MNVFDSHFHIIPEGYPLHSNAGFVPDYFSVKDYLRVMKPYALKGGVVVSGSFQRQDQGYLLDSLARLGEGYFGVTQLLSSVRDEEILALSASRVRGVRFNLRRGGSETVDNLRYFASRIYDLAKWHIEIYAGPRDISSLYDTLLQLPGVAIDHLGLDKASLPFTIKLAERGVKIKATGFGRLGFDPRLVIAPIYAANPSSLMFGSDLPGTRAPRPFCENDIALICDTLGEAAAGQVLYENAHKFYDRS
ncbi:amidohydrolase family protein [Microbulbifer agarilyticus]